MFKRKSTVEEIMQRRTEQIDIFSAKSIDEQKNDLVGFVKNIYLKPVNFSDDVNSDSENE